MATSGQLLADFLVYLGVELQVSPHTVAAYRRDIGRLLEGSDQLPTRTAITRHLDSLTKTHRPASIARAAAAIRGFYRFLHAEGLTDEDAARGLLGPRLERKLPKVFGRDAVTRLLSHQRTDTALGIRDAALLHVLYATGCRVTEATGLRLSSMVPEHRLLRCFGKGQKERLVPLSDPALALLEQYRDTVRPELRARARQDPKDVLFLSRTGRPLDRVRIWQIVRAASAKANLKANCSPHALRHSFATHLVAGGADLRSIQEMLGHASLAPTQIYTHVDHDRLKQVHSRFHPRG